MKTRTKVVATVGPACQSDELLTAMLDAGVNVFRLNFSHGTAAEHRTTMGRIRELAEVRGKVVAILADLGGPKIRLGKIAGGKAMLLTGGHLTFQRADIEGTAERLSTTYPAFVDDVQIGDRILIDDGNVRLKAVAKRPDELECVCEVPGVISDRKGINLPDTDVSVPALTEKDRADLKEIIAGGADYVALSFVRRAEDMQQLRQVLTEAGAGDVRIVSKIEKPEALQNIEPIVEASDAVLVARGDMGVEMDVWRVPMIQKNLTLLCARAGKPVIVATQMLQSMVDSPAPTRAEVSDVANAILDGADAVMLSAETSVGKYPLESVRMMRLAALQAEQFRSQHGDDLLPHGHPEVSVASAVVHGVNLVARELGVKLVAVWTETGNTARLLSKHHLAQPILALAPVGRVCRQCTLFYGVRSACMNPPASSAALLATLDKLVVERGWAAVGDKIILTIDSRPDIEGETDTMLVHVVGDGQAINLFS